MTKIEGIPDGWELVRIGIPKDGEFFMHGRVGDIDEYDEKIFYKSVYPIIRKVERPKTYRPFANAEEFRPYRNKWWRYKNRHVIYAAQPHSDDGYFGHTWMYMFEECEFEDGTPFGIED